MRERLFLRDRRYYVVVCGVRSVRTRRGALCGCGMCALKRAERRGGGLCHAGRDMRAYGAREGVAGMYGAGDSGEI